MVRQVRSIALVVAFLIGCAVFLMAGASGVLAEASQQNKHKHTEATNNEHLNPCARIDKKLDKNRHLSREESRIRASGFCNQGPDVVFAGRTSSASASTFALMPIDGGGPAILLPAAALLLGSGILTYAILRRR